MLTDRERETGKQLAAGWACAEKTQVAWDRWTICGAPAIGIDLVRGIAVCADHRIRQNSLYQRSGLVVSDPSRSECCDSHRNPTAGVQSSTRQPSVSSGASPSPEPSFAAVDDAESQSGRDLPSPSNAQTDSGSPSMSGKTKLELLASQITYDIGEILNHQARRTPLGKMPGVPFNEIKTRVFIGLTDLALMLYVDEMDDLSPGKETQDGQL